MNLVNELQLTDERPAVLQVKNTNVIQLLAVGLKKDQVLKKHTTPIPATLVVLKGRVVFDLNGTKTELDASSTFDIPVNEPHEVIGLEDSLFLVLKEKQAQG